MKNYALYLVTIISTFSLGLFFYTISPTGIAEWQILKLTKELHEAEIKKDRKKLEEILFEEISHSRYTTRVDFTKEEFIKLFEKPVFKIKSIKTSFLSVKIENNEARVFFWMKLSVYDEDGTPFDHVGNYTYTFEKMNGDWKLVSTHLEN